MSRAQWNCFLVGMFGLFPSVLLAATVGSRYALLQWLPLLFIAILLGGTLGIGLVRGARNMAIRRRGVPMFGHVIHARSCGYTDRVPTVEIDVQLPNGNVARKIVVTRSGDFRAGEPIKLLVDPKHPDRAALPPHPRRTVPEF